MSMFLKKLCLASYKMQLIKATGQIFSCMGVVDEMVVFIHHFYIS